MKIILRQQFPASKIIQDIKKIPRETVKVLIPRNSMTQTSGVVCGGIVVCETGCNFCKQVKISAHHSNIPYHVFALIFTLFIG